VEYIKEMILFVIYIAVIAPDHVPLDKNIVDLSLIAARSAGLAWIMVVVVVLRFFMFAMVQRRIVAVE
jgi:hypothetical protein